MNAEDGLSLWTFPEDPEGDGRGVFHITPALSEEYVIVASQVLPAGFFSQSQNIVWALDRDTGALLWRFDEAAGQYVEGGAIGGGLFVVGNSDGNVYALDLERGTLQWTFKTGHRVWATPLIVSDTVYVGSMDHHLYALRLSDGEVMWNFLARGAFAATPALQDDILYIGAFDDRLYGIDAHTGDERWHFAGMNWFWGSPVIHDDVVYAADVDGNVYAIDAESGKQIWRQSLDTPVRAGMALSEDEGLLFACGQDGALYALDIDDGFVLWSAESEGQALSKPAVGGAAVYESLIYGTYRIQALHVENGRGIWTYPTEVEE
jgi:outer membrane protein assembly factor BamB